jgi:PTH1 family peptidyl-tRNA hydrolase
MSIAVIAGLGNPGLKYRNTRHNIGFAVVDKLAANFGAEWKAEARFEADVAIVARGGRKLILVKPNTFMNASGRALGAILRSRGLAPQSLLVVYDDITLVLGRAKLGLGGSAGGHNGVSDLLAQLGPGFARYRIGVGAKPQKEMDLADYVLGEFSKDEQQLLAVQMPLYIEQLKLIIDKGSEHAMNLINQRTARQHERNEK